MNTPSALPRIPDLQAGLAFLSHLPLANPAQALPALAGFYESLIRDPLLPKQSLQLLEQARLALATVVDAHSRRFRDKMLPLGDVEEEAFRHCIDMWELAASAYARCAQADSGGDDGHAGRVALILHRCIHYFGLVIQEHYLARRELPPGVWLDLFGYYASAEEWQIASRPLEDPLEPEQASTHCAAALVTVLLTDLAGPYSYSAHDITLIRRWATLWSPLVDVHPVREGQSRPEYMVDLMQDAGLKFAPELPAGPDQRYLDTSRLAIQIRQVLAQLHQRGTPGPLGLGSDVSQGQCIRLLEALMRPWTQVSSPRRFRRRPATGVAHTAIGFEAIHYLVSGSEFSQPDSVRQYSRKDFETLFAFRHMVDPTQQLEIQKRDRDYPTDEWQVLNQSATGFRLARRMAGHRLAHGQLIGIRPPDGERMLLAQAHWLMQEQDGGLIAGVGILAGAPQAVAARQVGIGVSTSEPYVRAFMLPAIAAISSPSALVLPSGWYQADAMVEVHAETAWRAKLTRLITRGADFDEVEFALAG